MQLDRFQQACASRKFCGPCRADPNWRRIHGAPEICPVGITDPPQKPANALTSPDAAEIALRRAICARCPHFGLSECCGCGEARRDPARELSKCRWGYWHETQMIIDSQKPEPNQ